MGFHEQVHLIEHDLQRHNPPAMLVGVRADQPLTASRAPTGADRTTELRAPHDVIPQVVHVTSRNLHFPGHAGDYTHRLCQTPRFRCR